MVRQRASPAVRLEPALLTAQCAAGLMAAPLTEGWQGRATPTPHHMPSHPNTPCHAGPEQGPCLGGADPAGLCLPPRGARGPGPVRAAAQPGGARPPAALAGRVAGLAQAAGPAGGGPGGPARPHLLPALHARQLFKVLRQAGAWAVAPPAEGASKRRGLRLGAHSPSVQRHRRRRSGRGRLQLHTARRLPPTRAPLRAAPPEAATPHPRPLPWPLRTCRAPWPWPPAPAPP